MPLPLPKAGALLLGAGGAGCATMAGLVLADLAGGMPAEARVGVLAFGLLLSVPVALALSAILRAGHGPALPGSAKALATLGTLFWLGGLGMDLYVPGQGGGALLAAHSMAAVGGAALALAGAQLRPLAGTRAQRRARERA